MANKVLIITIVVFALILILGIVGLTLYLVLSKKTPVSTTNNTNPSGTLPPTVIPVNPINPINPTGPTNNPGPSPGPRPPPTPAPGAPSSPIGTLSNSIYYLISGSSSTYTTVGSTTIPVYVFTNKYIYNIQRRLYLAVAFGQVSISTAKGDYTWSYDGRYITSHLDTRGLGLSTSGSPNGQPSYNYVSFETRSWCFDGYAFYISTTVNGFNYITQPALTMEGTTEYNRTPILTTNLANVGFPLTSLDIWTVVD